MYNDNNEHKLRLRINGESYEWNHQYITGSEIRNLGNIPQDEKILLAIKRPWEDEPIFDNTKVDLARPGIEHFYSVKHDNHSVEIIVNGRPKVWTKRKISYKEVVMLAFGNYDDNDSIIYTVTYTHGPGQNPEGNMVKGVEVYVKNRMIFNVTATNRS